MDPAALLDINTPFDDQKQLLLENVVHTFYHTKNNSEVN